MPWKSSHVHQSMTGADHLYHKSALTHSLRAFTQAQPQPQSAATHPITINLCARCPSGPGYRWFIFYFIKETGVPLKRDQSATRHEESASNWPFIKKPSQVDRSAEISCMTTEPHYINYTTDEPHALQLTPCDCREAGKHTDARTPGHACVSPEYTPRESEKEACSHM